MYVCMMWSDSSGGMWSDSSGGVWSDSSGGMWSYSSGGRASDCRSMGHWFEPHLWREVQKLLMIHESAFYWPGCTQPSIPPGSVQ